MHGMHRISCDSASESWGRLTVAKPEEGASEAEGPVAKTTANLKHNTVILKPLVAAMKNLHDRVPCIEALESQILQLFDIHGKTPSRTALNQEAWNVRYMFGLLKQQLYRPKVTKVSWSHSTTFLDVHPQDPGIRELLAEWGIDLQKLQACRNHSQKLSRQDGKKAAPPSRSNSSISEASSSAIPQAKLAQPDASSVQAMVVLRISG